MNTQELKISQVRIDGGTQPRVEINQEVVADYAEQLRSGAVFPPVVAFFDGVVYWLADGFHRYHSHRQAGREIIIVDVREGGLRDAILYSVGANSEHGLRRTNEDKRRAVETMLTNEIVSKDENGQKWSDNSIARQCNVTHPFVGKIRQQIHTCNGYKYETKQRTFTHPKTGKPAVMNTSKIGKSKPQKRKTYGQIAPNAFKPVRQARPSLAQTPIDLPHDPHYAARALVSAMGREFTEKLIVELTNYLKGC